MNISPSFSKRGCWKTVKANEINVIAQRSSLLMSQAWFGDGWDNRRFPGFAQIFSRLKTRLLYANEEEAKFAAPFRRGTEHGVGYVLFHKICEHRRKSAVLGMIFSEEPLLAATSSPPVLIPTTRTRDCVSRSWRMAAFAARLAARPCARRMNSFR